MSVLAALPRPLYIVNVFFGGFGQIECNSLPVLSLVQANSHCSRVFRSSASLIVACDLPSFYPFNVLPESHSLHFRFSALIFSIL